MTSAQPTTTATEINPATAPPLRKVDALLAHYGSSHTHPSNELIHFVAIVIGFSLLNWGALLYVKYTLYVDQPENLMQQICIRVSLTGTVLASFTGLADYLGFGSHVVELGSNQVFFGSLQAGAVLTFLIISSLGVLLYALAGNALNNP